MRLIAHLSDLHFGRIDERVVEGLLADLDAAPPHLIVVSGDLTQRALHSQFAAARRFLDALPSPSLVIPGNHDLPPLWRPFSRMTRTWERYRRYVSTDLGPVYADPHMVVLGVNTARPLRWKEGSISPRQIERVGEILAPHEDGVFKIVCTHHPFLPPPDSPGTGIVRRAGRALRTFEQVGVDLLLAGHLHRAFTGDVITHHAVIKRSILVAQASTATSTRLRAEPNAYNWIALDGDMLRLQSRVWDGTRFVSADGEAFRKTDGQWVQVRGEPVPVE
ncbi:MAG: metallophosphoesterase family protein [Alphaproteobacteria bacterium]